MPDRTDDSDLDPVDWNVFTAQAHKMLDDSIEYVKSIRKGPVWRAMPESVRQALHEPLPRRGSSLGDVHAQFMACVLPYASGNVHPGFTAWVHGGGNTFGALGEMLAAAINANLGGRDHGPIEVERQVIRWWAELFGWPSTTTGLMVTGSALANFIAVLVARTKALGVDVRRTGVSGSQLTAYTSIATHACVARAMDFAGLGSDKLRRVATDDHFRIEIDQLVDAIRRDRAAGCKPFLVVGTAGTVDTGAIDNLVELARVCREEGLWFHVDGAFGALAALSPALRPLVSGLEEADSLAFDLHKWGQVPYDAGCILVRDGANELATFAGEAAYLRRESRGLAAGAPWPCDLGPDNSRSFRALKVWYTFKVLGAERIGAAIERMCALARELGQRVDESPELERVAPISLNVVCFRYRFESNSDVENAALAADIQESGLGATSTTRIANRLVLRCAITNHRTRKEDIDRLVTAVLTLGQKRAGALSRK